MNPNLPHASLTKSFRPDTRNPYINATLQPNTNLHLIYTQTHPNTWPPPGMRVHISGAPCGTCGAPCGVTYLSPAEPYYIIAQKNNDDRENYKRDWGRNNKAYNGWKRGGGGAGEILTMADEGGRGGLNPPIFGWHNLWTAPYSVLPHPLTQDNPSLTTHSTWTFTLVVLPSCCLPSSMACLCSWANILRLINTSSPLLSHFPCN